LREKFTTMQSIKMVIVFIVACHFVLVACNSKKTNRKKYLLEIKNTEKDFNVSIKALGVAEAFALYADSNAVILRGNDSIIKGKSAIRSYYSKPFFNGASVKWAPDFSEVSANGDLAYSYGKYVWVLKDSTGKENTYKGIYHTLWKKQPDGRWKYVWD
jgi:ketosteroid isomerase-like protein